MEPQSHWIAKTILRKKNKGGGITQPNTKLYYKTRIIKATWYWHKNRHVGQWNRIENPEINSHLYSPLIYEKEDGNIQGVKQIYSINGFGENQTDTCKRMKLDQFLTPYSRINPTWIKDLNVRYETIKFLRENIGSKLFNITLSNIFLMCLLWQKKQKMKLNNWDCIKLKMLCTVKNTINTPSNLKAFEWLKRNQQNGKVPNHMEKHFRQRYLGQEFDTRNL